MTARDYSVMPVKILPDERVSLQRAVRGRGSMRPGAYVDVEIGATWATDPTGTFKVPGQWYQCRIERVEHSELHVRLSPSPKGGPPAFG